MEIKSIVGARLGSLTFNKSTSTNPFERTSFKGKAFGGSVLPFADVFQKIKPVEIQKPNKIKMVSGAVIGAIVDFKTRLTQPIALFASRVRQNIALGIDRVREMKNSMIAMGKNMHGRIAQVFDWHKVEEPTVSGAKILSLKHINEKAPVHDLKATWIAENEKIASKSEGKAVA
ncbi:hypothetical protein J6O48_01310 [bacterium]|nr:hypothetical protein [bacterium]